MSDDDLLALAQPVCENCWRERTRGAVPPVTSNPKTGEQTTHDLVNCCLCSSFTDAGIWVAVDPELVPYPYVRRRK